MFLMMSRPSVVTFHVDQKSIMDILASDCLTCKNDILGYFVLTFSLDLQIRLFNPQVIIHIKTKVIDTDPWASCSIIYIKSSIQIVNILLEHLMFVDIYNYIYI